MKVTKKLILSSSKLIQCEITFRITVNCEVIELGSVRLAYYKIRFFPTTSHFFPFEKSLRRTLRNENEMKENPVNGNELVAFEIFSRSEPLTQNRAEFFGLRSMARIIVRWHWQPGRQKRKVSMLSYFVLYHLDYRITPWKGKWFPPFMSSLTNISFSYCNIKEQKGINTMLYYT